MWFVVAGVVAVMTERVSVDSQSRCDRGWFFAPTVCFPAMGRDSQMARERARFESFRNGIGIARRLRLNQNCVAKLQKGANHAGNR